MTIPNYQAIMVPLLKELSDCNEYKGSIDEKFIKTL